MPFGNGTESIGLRSCKGPKMTNEHGDGPAARLKALTRGEQPVRDPNLVGLWSMDALYGPGAQSDDLLVFMPNGTGRYEFLNWKLYSAELFHWETRAWACSVLSVTDSCASRKIHGASWKNRGARGVGSPWWEKAWPRLTERLLGSPNVEGQSTETRPPRPQ